MVLKLNRTATEITRAQRNLINDNWSKLEDNFNNVVKVAADSASEQIIDSARLIWQEPVPVFSDLPTTYPNAVEGWAAWTREVVGGVSKAYRYNGTQWIEYQQFNGDAINEVDNRLDLKITENEKQIEKINDRGYDLKDFVIESETSYENAFRRAFAAIRQRALQSNFRDIPLLKVAAGYYTLKEEIRMSPIVKIKAEGQVKFLVDHPGAGFWIVAESDDEYTVNGVQDYDLTKNSWNRGNYFDGTNGAFIFTTTYRNDATAIEIGLRTRPADLRNDYFPTSRYVLSNVGIFNFKYGLKLNIVDNYLGKFNDFHIEGCIINVFFNEVTTSENYAGENFVFDGGILSGALSRNGIDAYNILVDSPSVDATFMNMSINFAPGTTAKITHSGSSIRFNNCYFEDGGATDGPFAEVQPKIPGSPSFGGNASFYFSNCISLRRNPTPLFVNKPYNNNGVNEYMFMNLVINSFEFRYGAAIEEDFTNLDNRFLTSGDNIRIYDHKVIKAQQVRNPHLSKQLNLIRNYDFSESTVGLDLRLDESDSYWRVTYNLNISNTPRVEIINGIRCVGVVYSNSNQNGLTLAYKESLNVNAGDIYDVSLIYSTNRIWTGTDLIMGMYCYNEKNVLIDTLTYYARTQLSDNPANITDAFRFNRGGAIITIPPGVKTVKPFFTCANSRGDYFRISQPVMTKMN